MLNICIFIYAISVIVLLLICLGSYFNEKISNKMSLNSIEDIAIGLGFAFVPLANTFISVLVLLTAFKPKHIHKE